MIDFGFPNIRGYQARSNYQTLLAQVVSERVGSNQILEQAALSAVQQPAIAPVHSDFVKVKCDAPMRRHKVSERTTEFIFRALKRDYLQREATNASLGWAGEQFVVGYERWRLTQLGQHQLADRVEHVSDTKGDGLGYDVLSFDPSGQERLIEVKTTTFGKETPFFVSRGELALSKQAREQFHLYRLFEFRAEPKLFDLPGQLDTHCDLDPVTYRATFS